MELGIAKTKSAKPNQEQNYEAKGHPGLHSELQTRRTTLSQKINKTHTSSQFIGTRKS